MVAAERAWTIGALLMVDPGARIGADDRYFATGSATISAEGARLIDEAIARRRQAGGFLVFVHPQYGADALELRRADAFGQALYDRGATGIMADGDDFPAGQTEADTALRVELDAYKQSVTQPVVVVEAYQTNPAEGSASLAALGLKRAGTVRDYLTARGVPYGLMTVYTAGSSDPAVAAQDNRWVQIVSAPSGW